MGTDTQSATISIYDRARGQIIAERVFGRAALTYLYHGEGRWLVDRLLSRPLANSIYGQLQRAPLGQSRIRAFVDDLGIDASEAEKALESYRTLDDFFTRRLRRGARPIDETPEHLISPADGRVLVIARLDGAGLQVKGSRVSLEELLDSRGAAERYQAGAAFIVRLAPADYHRFHFPDSGVASKARSVGGRLHSVHPIALSAGAPSFRNKRVLTYLDTDRFGRLALIDVGALCVGTIIQSYSPGPVRRGQEKGYFRFGGSTVIVLAEPGRLRFDDDLIQNSAAGLETLVKMGTRIGRQAPAATEPG
jgi:phosphatidylserine decarboxylase